MLPPTHTHTNTLTLDSGFLTATHTSHTRESRERCVFAGCEPVKPELPGSAQGNAGRGIPTLSCSAWCQFFWSVKRSTLKANTSTPHEL